MNTPTEADLSEPDFTAFVDALRSRLSITEVIGNRVRLKKRGRDHLGLCPFHKEKTPSFTVSEDKGFFHCFGCGAHGDVVGFVMRSDNLSFPEAVERLARDVGMQVPPNMPKRRHREDQRETAVAFMDREIVTLVAVVSQIEEMIAEKRRERARYGCPTCGHHDDLDDEIPF